MSSTYGALNSYWTRVVKVGRFWSTISTCHDAYVVGSMISPINTTVLKLGRALDAKRSKVVYLSKLSRQRVVGWYTMVMRSINMDWSNVSASRTLSSLDVNWHDVSAS